MNLDDTRFSGSRVVAFRPRRKKSRPDRPDKSAFRNSDAASPVRDFAKYQKSPVREDYGHRMRMNAIIFAFMSMLAMAGVWIVTMIAHPHA